MTTEITGYIASALVLLTFMAKDMRLLTAAAQYRAPERGAANH